MRLFTRLALLCFLIAAPALAAEKQLTLENVFLEHADPVSWEPGDAKSYFPVAGEIFYGFRSLDDYEIVISPNCKSSIQVKVFEGNSPRDREYQLWCSPFGNKAKAFKLTRDSRNFGQEESMDPEIVYGTNFDWMPGVSLKKIGKKKYLLQID